MIWSIVFVAVCSYIGFMVLIFLLQPRFIYFPEREFYETPDKAGLSYETVSFKAADGVNLSGWFIPAGKPRGVVLFCHGNAGNISHRLDSILVFHHLGLSTFIFDYRGYGASEGKPTEAGTYLDAEAAWRYLTEERDLPPTGIILFGRSLGGAIAARIAQDHKPEALIVESTFTSVPDIAADIYPFLPVRLLSRFDYNAGEYIGRVACPVLVIHSTGDDIIPFAHGRRLFEAAKEPKQFLEIAGTHNDGFVTSAKSYKEGLDAFISKHLGAKTSR
ncbi:MAG: alpha/beta hydrolase [Deltaproteobacteria bacterium]|nr:alpha/beta hydrolase [Deltaproteobacteria bacterium]